MDLAAYISMEKLTYTELAERLSVSTAAVHRYVKEGRVPTPDVMRRITTVTNGAVQPNDFFETTTDTPALTGTG